MLKYKDFETLNYMRDIVKSWTEKADSPAIIDNTDFLTGRQCAAIAKAAIDVMEANGTQRGDVVAFTGSDTLAKIPVLEWANIISEDLPKEYIRIEFKYVEKEDERLVDIKYIGNKEKETT